MNRGGPSLFTVTMIFLDEIQALDAEASETVIDDLRDRMIGRLFHLLVAENRRRGGVVRDEQLFPVAMEAFGFDCDHPLHHRKPLDSGLRPPAIVFYKNGAEAARYGAMLRQWQCACCGTIGIEEESKP